MYSSSVRMTRDNWIKLEGKKKLETAQEYKTEYKTGTSKRWKFVVYKEPVCLKNKDNRMGLKAV